MCNIIGTCRFYNTVIGGRLTRAANITGFTVFYYLLVGPVHRDLRKCIRGKLTYPVSAVNELTLYLSQ